jgi:glutathione S-transferase
MKLYYHPVSSYSQKVLFAIYEKHVPFEPAIVNMLDTEARDAFSKTVPIAKIPATSFQDGRVLTESSIIIEELDDLFPTYNPRLVPEDPKLAREVRWLDRQFDFYFNDPMAKIFFDGRRPGDSGDPYGVARAKATLDRAYATFDELLASRTWAAGDTFSLADCAAAPPLAYLRMVYPYEKYTSLSGYAARLISRPCFQRVMDEARPYLEMMMAGRS